MKNLLAKANVDPVRQRTQYTCMSTSMMMALRSLGFDVYEDEVNQVLGAKALRGAAWEHALGAAQHYGVRGTLVTPSTIPQLKGWTDKGNPVIISWNPEGRDWSHCSVVFDVDDEMNVYVADPNIPDPDETVRVVPKGEFYKLWYEKWPKYLVRRPAMMLEREVTPDGRQVMAGWAHPINLPSLDSLQLRSLGRGTHPKVLERRVKDIATYLAKGMSPKRAVVQWFKDNGDRLPEDYPKSPRGTDMQLKDLADSLYKQLTGIAVGLIKQASRQVMASRVALFAVRPDLKVMARKMGDVLDEYGIMGVKVKPFNSGYEGVRLEFPPGSSTKNITYYDQPGKVGPEDQTGGYISLEVDRKEVFKKKHPANKFGDVNFTRSDKARINQKVLSIFTELVADALAPDNMFEFRRARITAASRPSKEELDSAKDAKWQDWEVQKLPDDLFKYFKKVPGAIEVEVSDLTPIRAREKGVANANRFMWLAYHGAMDRRKPVSLQDNGDGTYTVLDGNSTFANAKKNGWKKLYGKIEKTKSANFIREAAKKDLQALDFVAGLIRQFDRRGQSVSNEVDNATLLRRVIALRKEVQKGFDLSLLADNTDVLRGKGKKIVKNIEKLQDIEALMTPSSSALKAFQKSYADREKGARKAQADFLRKLIKSKLKRELDLLRSIDADRGGDWSRDPMHGAKRAKSLPEISDGDLDDLVMNNRAFFNEAFAVVNKYVAGQMSKVSSALSGSPGKFEIRSKAEQSTWDKSAHRKKVPFYSLGDLLGCRSVTDSLKGMMETCEEAQAKIDVVAKENKFGGYGGYNAVHYALLSDKLVVEYQIKANVNKLEAGISHDLVLSDDKFRARFEMDPLPQSQKDLVIRVINVSTQMSMRDFAEVVEGLEFQGDKMDDLLYGDPEKSEEDIVRDLQKYEDPLTQQRRLANILAIEGLRR